MSIPLNSAKQNRQISFHHTELDLPSSRKQRPFSSSIGFLGGGNMAEALIVGLVKSAYPADSIFVSDRETEKLSRLKKTFKINAFSQNIEVVRQADFLVLAVKPQDVPAVLFEIAPFLSPKRWLISIAAGLDIETLRRLIGVGLVEKAKKTEFLLSLRILRAMPNTPALIQAGMTALFAEPSPQKSQKKLLEGLFSGAGDFVWMDREADLDAVTGLSGSGPAYVYTFVEALIQAGEKLGLSIELSKRLALQTVLGAASLLEKSGESPQALIERVSSKKGTTVAGLSVLKKQKWAEILMKAVETASKRAREICLEYQKK